MRKAAPALPSFFLRSGLFKRRTQGRSEHVFGPREAGRSSATSSRIAASELESGLRAGDAAVASVTPVYERSQERDERSIGDAVGLHGGLAISYPVDVVSPDNGVLHRSFDIADPCSESTGKDPAVQEPQELAAQTTAGGEPDSHVEPVAVVRDEDGNDPAPMPASQDGTESASRSAAATAAMVCIQAICDVFNFYASEWLFIVRLAWPEVQNVVLALLGVCVVIGPGLCVAAAYFASWTCLVCVTVCLLLATGLFGVLRRHIFPTSL